MDSAALTRYDASPSYISSRDAYMLVYARLGEKGCPTPPRSQANGNGTVSNAGSSTSISPADVVPPSRAMEVVQSLNAAHRKACEEYSARSAHSPRVFSRMLIIVQREGSESKV